MGRGSPPYAVPCSAARAFGTMFRARSQERRIGGRGPPGVMLRRLPRKRETSTVTLRGGNVLP